MLTRVSPGTRVFTMHVYEVLGYHRCHPFSGTRVFEYLCDFKVCSVEKNWFRLFKRCAYPKQGFKILGQSNVLCVNAYVYQEKEGGKSQEEIQI